MSMIGRQLRELRLNRGLSQDAVARATGVEQATISLIERGRMELVSPHLAKLARHLGVDLVNPLGENVQRAPVDGARVPVWPQSEAAALAAQSPQEQEKRTNTYMMSAQRHSENAFAMVLTDDSMLHRFRPGDRVIVDPEVPPAPGRYVAAQMGDSPGAILGQYAARSGGVFELLPLNTLYASHRSDQVALRVLGVAVERSEPLL